FAHDGTERRIVRPQDPVEQTDCYSGKKKDHTIKNVLLVNAPSLSSSSVAERLTNASAWYSWHREEVTHGYHQAMGARWRRRASGDRVGRTRPSRYSQRRVDGRISFVCD